MKCPKTAGFLLAALLLFPGAALAGEPPGMTIPKAETAPAADGVIGRNEYTVRVDGGFAFIGDKAPESHPEIYAAYDDRALYLACRIDCREHLCEIEGESYIFSKHHVMIGLTPTDPAEDPYKPKSGGEWDWSEAYASCLGREFSLACLQADGAQAGSIHFPAPASYAGDWKTAVPDTDFRAVHKEDADIYEVAIPWDFIDPEQKNQRQEGSKLGLSVCIGIGDLTAGDGQFVQYGAGVTGYKNFADYRPVKLGGVHTGTPVDGTPGGAAGEKAEFPVWLVVVPAAAACVTAAGIVVAVRFVRRRRGGQGKGETP